MRRTAIALIIGIMAPFTGSMAFADSPGEIALPAKERTGLALTIYNDGLALVNDDRAASLESGRHQLAFEGVSPEAIAESTVLRADKGLTVRALDYDFDILTPESLMRRYVGKPVGVVHTNPTTGEELIEEAVLLSAGAQHPSSDPRPVLLYSDRIEIGTSGRLVFFQLPGDLRPLPTLVATVDSGGGGQQALALSYLTDGLAWRADYVATVSTGEPRLNLEGRATVTNTTGITFDDASVGLIAGHIRRVSTMQRSAPREAMMAAPMADQAAAKGMERDAVGDLHLYKIDGTVTLADKESKQLALLAAADVPMTRTYVSESFTPVFGQHGTPDGPSHPNVVLSFENTAQSNLGMPLPAGVVRFYTSDADGVVRLLGEDWLGNTVAGETVKLSPGLAFDISVKREQTDFSRVSQTDNVFESAYRIVVTNGKPESASVILKESIPGDWKILEESAPHEKDSADTAAWTLSVPADGTASLTYRVRVQR